MPRLRTQNVARIMLLVACISGGACNPTWTKEGKPNDSSMPVPPDATPPKQVGESGTSAAPKP